MGNSTAEFLTRAAMLLALALVPILVWRLFDVILIGIGAILVATALRLGAEPFVRIKLPHWLALIFSGLVIIGVGGAAVYLFGSKIVAELQDVLQRTQAGQGSITNDLQGYPLGRLVLSHVGNATFSITDIVDNFFSMSTAFFEAVVVTLFAGFYLAAQPSLYRDGLISLAPLGAREKVRTTLDVMAQALRLWLVGQFIQMALIGLLSALAALAIGLPSPLALGLIAGVAEFIPYLGPIIAAVPALLVAATVSVHTVLWTLFVYFLIHQVEADLIVPLMQRRMVYIPPVVMLMSVAALTYLFGWSVIIFAAPIVVILFVGVNKLYVRDCLGETVQLPGELEPSEPKTRIIGSDAASLKLG